MLTTARHEMYPIIKKLWRTSFGDDEAYTDFIFSHIPPEQVLVWLEDRTVAASLCFQPLDFCAPQGSAKAAYMFGFNTHPNFRGKGIGTKLLAGYDEYMEARDFAASCLAPAGEGLFDYYGQRGYEKYFSIKKIEIETKSLKPGAGCVLVPRGLDTLYNARGRMFGQSGLYARWPRSFLGFLNEECRLRGGQVLRTSCCGDEGYAVCLPVGEKLLINEFAVARGNASAVLYALYKRFGSKSVEIRARADYPADPAAQVLPFVMVRWYDKRREKEFKGYAATGAAPYFAHILD